MIVLSIADATCLYLSESLALPVCLLRFYGSGEAPQTYFDFGHQLTVSVQLQYYKHSKITAFNTWCISRVQLVSSRQIQTYDRTMPFHLFKEVKLHAQQQACCTQDVLTDSFELE